jgi:hypothetical protein
MLDQRVQSVGSSIQNSKCIELSFTAAVFTLLAGVLTLLTAKLGSKMETWALKRSSSVVKVPSRLIIAESSLRNDFMNSSSLQPTDPAKEMFEAHQGQQH